jgi:hypothetical protein
MNEHHGGFLSRHEYVLPYVLDECACEAAYGQLGDWSCGWYMEGCSALGSVMSFIGELVVGV